MANKPIVKYTVILTEVQRQVMLDALDLAIEHDIFTDRIEDQQASHLREGLEGLPYPKTTNGQNDLT